jgi:hypothetical protein
MKLFEDGDPCFAPMLNALFAAFRGTAVMSGCEVSATGTSRTVSITAGSVQINGEVIVVGAGSVTLDAGSTFDRYDLVSVDASGSKIVTKGTTKRKCPTQPANTCLLAIVFVPAGATVIATGDVYDARMDAPNLAVAAIECAGTIRNQTGNIGARSQFVDIPGNTVRKSVSYGSTILGSMTQQVASVVVPTNYSSVPSSSNLRVVVEAPSWSSPYSSLTWTVTVKRNGVAIGSASGEVAGNKTLTVDTTGGFAAGETLSVEVSTPSNSAMYGCTTSFRSARSTDIPAYKVFPTGGSW